MPLPLPQYSLMVRNNATGLQVDEIADYLKIAGSFLFNEVSHLLVALDPRSPHLVNVTKDSSGNYPNGFILTRDNLDGNGPIELFSGNITHLAVDWDASQSPDYSILVTAASDDKKLRGRLALPSIAYTYAALINSFSPLRYYRLGETSGTVATDTSGHANGTYTGGVTLAQAALIDDIDDAVLFDGTSGYVSVPTAGLPTGNAAWTVLGWGILTANPAAEIDLWNFGTNASKQAVHLGVLSSGDPFVAPYFIGATTGATPIPLNQPFLLAATWDGTTLTGYLFSQGLANGGGAFGSQTPGALTIAYGSAQFGSQFGTGNFWPSFGDEGAFFSGALTAAQLAQIFAVGSCYLDYQAYDSRTGVVSTLMSDFARDNAGAGALAARQFSNLVLDADPLLGGTVTELLRYNTLLEALQNLSLRATSELGFKVQQPLTDTKPHFTIYQPRNQTSVATFSKELGNLIKFAYQADTPVTNAAYVGGAGSGTSRLVYPATDSASITAWGERIEKFYNHSNLKTKADLLNQATADLANDGEQNTLGFLAVDTPACIFGRDYNLGDLVTVSANLPNGQTIEVQDIIRQVDLTIQPGQRDQIQPVIGAPNALHPLTFNKAVHRLISHAQKAIAPLTNYQ